MVNHSSFEKINVIGRASDVFGVARTNFRGISWARRACSGLGMKRSSHPCLPVRPHSDCDVPYIPSLSHHEASRRRPKE